MDREHGAREAVDFVRRLAFGPVNAPSTQRSKTEEHGRTRTERRYAYKRIHSMTIRQRHTCRCLLAVIALTCGLMVNPASGADQSDGNDRFTVRTGLAFCDVDPQLCLDLYLPKQDGGPVPCVIVIQGGGFLPQDGQRFRPFASYLAEHGMAAALIAYRGRPDHKYRDTVADAKAADCRIFCVMSSASP